MSYATDQLKLALGRRTTLFVKKQTARGTIAVPAAADTVLIASGGNFKQQYQYHEDTQKRDTRDELRGVQGILPHGEFDFTAFAKPSGSAGTDPELTDVIEGALGSKVAGAADTVQAAPAPTTGGCRVSSGANFAVGEVRYVALATGPEMVRILTVVTDDITWEPALSVAPTAGDNIRAAVHYIPTTDLNDYSIWIKKDDRVYAFQDCGFSKIGSKIDGKSPFEVSVNGGFIKFYMAGTDEVDTGGITDIATTLPAKDGYKFLPGAGCYIKVEDEIMGVTGQSGNNLTVTRAQMGTAAAAHAAGVAITPWYPTITEGGALVHCKLGKPRWQLGSTWEDLPSMEMSWEYDNQLKWIDEEKNGDGVSAGFVAAGARKVTGTLRFLYRRKWSKLYAHAIARTVAKIIVPIGNAVGSSWAIVIPQADILLPDITGDEEQIVEVALRVYATTAYNDSFSIHEL